jgi:hypothetical protein
MAATQEATEGEVGAGPASPLACGRTTTSAQGRAWDMEEEEEEAAGMGARGEKTGMGAVFGAGRGRGGAARVWQDGDGGGAGQDEGDARGTMGVGATRGRTGPHETGAARGGRMGFSSDEKRNESIMSHLPVAMVSNFPQLQKTWIWWSTP